MDQNTKRRYLSVTHLLTDSFVLSRREEYPQARVMDAARRRLTQACFRFDPWQQEYSKKDSEGRQARHAKRRRDVARYVQ